MLHPSKLQAKPYSGYFGVGLRPEHFDDVLSLKPKVDYFEVLADNYLNLSGPAIEKLLRVRELYPLSLHCVGLSIATASAPSQTYLDKLKALANLLNAELISDHLCWTGAHGHYTHELMPFPYTQETLGFVKKKVDMVQEILEQPVMFENATRYVSYNNNTMDEANFLNKLCAQTGCGILLDINNLYVNQCNLGEDISEYLNTLEPKHVWQMHLGGFSRQADHLLDTHSDKVDKEVWPWYSKAQSCFKHVPTIIEWDNELPPFSTLYDELIKARHYARQNELNQVSIYA